jgi:hypothetical protein
MLTHPNTKKRRPSTLPLAALSGVTASGVVRLNHHSSLTPRLGCDLNGCSRETLALTYKRDQKIALACVDSVTRVT